MAQPFRNLGESWVHAATDREISASIPAALLDYTSKDVADLKVAPQAYAEMVAGHRSVNGSYTVLATNVLAIRREVA